MNMANRAGSISFLDDSTWADFVEQDKVTLMFFMSGNHLECRRQVPRIKDFAARYGDQFNVAVIDVAKAPIAARCCDVHDLPTTVIVRRGVFMGGRRGGIDPCTEGELVLGLSNIQREDMTKYLEDPSERVCAFPA